MADRISDSAELVRIEGNLSRMKYIRTEHCIGRKTNLHCRGSDYTAAEKRFLPLPYDHGSEKQVLIPQGY